MNSFAPTKKTLLCFLLTVGVALSGQRLAAQQLRFRDLPADRDPPSPRIAFDASKEGSATRSKKLSEVQFDTQPTQRSANQRSAKNGAAPSPFRIDSPGETPPLPRVYESPKQVMNEINDDLQRVGARETQALDKIRKGFTLLQQSNERLREKALDERRAMESAHRRALRAEQVADDAKNSAQVAQDVAMETIRRMKEFEQRMKENPAAAPVSQSPEPQKVAETPPSPNGTAPEQPPTTTLSPSPQPPERMPASMPPPPPASRPITLDVVDRERLADSLFGAGEYRLSMEVYQEMLKDNEQAEDKAWFTYQIAGCLRHLGDWKRAEKYYRRVAADKEAEYLASTSRWWLSVVDDHRNLTEQLKVWSSQLNHAEENQ